MDGSQLAWDMYFATLVGWQYHPGRYGKDFNLEELGQLADRMLEVRNARYRRIPVGQPPASGD